MANHKSTIKRIRQTVGKKDSNKYKRPHWSFLGFFCAVPPKGQQVRWLFFLFTFLFEFFQSFKNVGHSYLLPFFSLRVGPSMPVMSARQMSVLAPTMASGTRPAVIWNSLISFIIVSSKTCLSSGLAVRPWTTASCWSSHVTRGPRLPGVSLFLNLWGAFQKSV